MGLPIPFVVVVHRNVKAPKQFAKQPILVVSKRARDVRISDSLPLNKVVKEVRYCGNLCGS